MKIVYLIASLGLAFLCRTTIHAQALYDVNTIQKIEVSLSQPDWDYQMDTAKHGAEGYLMADSIKINGVVYDSVGIKYKGNSSFDSTQIKNPLHIEFNAFKSQKHQGFTDIKLSNGYGDPSLLREVLAYKILGNYMHCSQSNFAQVYINGQYIGIYSSAENIDKKFCADHFYSSQNAFIKCNPIISPGPTTKSNFRFIDADSNSYANYYEIKSKSGWKQLVELCDTITNKATEIESILDMDRAIWMLAFNNLFVNLDSYSGVFAQNHYTYRDHTNHYNPIIWDLNMCFGAFPFAGAGATSMGTISVSGATQFSISNHGTDTYWPLISVVQNNMSYKRKYVAHMKTIIEEQLSAGLLSTTVNQLHALIDTAVQSDIHKSFSTAQFQTSLNTNIPFGSYTVPGLVTFMNDRAAYLLGTTDFTAVAPSITNIIAPTNPTINTSIAIQATITGGAITSAYLGYRFDKREKFAKAILYDDGAHNDGAANDNVFGCDLLLQNSNVQYYIYAENNEAGKFSPQRAEHEFYTLKANAVMPSAGNLVINEILCENINGLKDEYNDTEDWIELYNNSTSVLDLSTTYLSDNFTDLLKWKIPDNTCINPTSFITIWADEDAAQQIYHTNFKLNKDSGVLYLSNAIGTIIDSVHYGAQVADISYGRYPNGIGSFQSMNTSYGAVNNNWPLSVLPTNPKMQVIIYPNPAENKLNIAFDGKQRVQLFSMYGQEIFSTIATNKLLISTNTYPRGLYLLKVGNSVHKVLLK
jgi:spore coat protein CotH